MPLPAGWEGKADHLIMRATDESGAVILPPEGAVNLQWQHAARAGLDVMDWLGSRPNEAAEIVEGCGLVSPVELQPLPAAPSYSRRPGQNSPLASSLNVQFMYSPTTLNKTQWKKLRDLWPSTYFGKIYDAFEAGFSKPQADDAAAAMQAVRAEDTFADDWQVPGVGCAFRQSGLGFQRRGFHFVKAVAIAVRVLDPSATLDVAISFANRVNTLCKLSAQEAAAVGRAAYDRSSAPLDLDVAAATLSYDFHVLHRLQGSHQNSCPASLPGRPHISSSRL